ncbi:MAG: SHOCT domain-containing protein [Hyphomicrobiaceae bacterium]|nr:SHOCT domain-containing protein [Hyphomicrobiaceae bacterium]
MAQLSDQGLRIVADVAARHGFSQDAVTTLLLALAAGNGTQAQFSHPEAGGMGQWSQGGMIMIGDMFNNMLKGRVDSVLSELSGHLRDTGVFAASGSFQSQSQSGGGQSHWGGGQSQSSGSPGNWQSSGSPSSLFVPGSTAPSAWWPADLGQPASVGAQNDLRYAYFPGSRRLAIDVAGQVTVYDSGDHAIGGFSQQQGGGKSLTFTSQYGIVRVADLPVVSPTGSPPTPAPTPGWSPPAWAAEAAAPAPMTARAAPSADATGDIISLIERLAGLHDKGMLTKEEFESKKAELLARI